MPVPLGDPVVIVVDRNDVQQDDISSTLNRLNRFVESPETTLLYRERVDIVFHGYDADHRELSEIPEVRQFVAEINGVFPYWLFFLTRESSGLQALAFCFLPPYLTPEAQRQIWPQRLDELVERR